MATSRIPSKVISIESGGYIHRKLRHRVASAMPVWTQWRQNPSIPHSSPMASAAAPSTNLKVSVVVLTQQLEESQDGLHNQDRHPHLIVLPLLPGIMALPKPQGQRVSGGGARHHEGLSSSYGQPNPISIRLSHKAGIGLSGRTRPHTFGARVRLIFVLTRFVPNVTHVHRHRRLGLLLSFLHPVVQNFEELLGLLVARHQVVK